MGLMTSLVIKTRITACPNWSQLKWRLPREQALTIWKAIKFKRISQSKPLGLSDEKGMPFVYCNAPAMDAILHQLDKIAGGNIAVVAGSVATGSLQSRFLVSSLMMEEAITSAQLEGALTTREVAKKMLEDEREPEDESQRMILNNYLLLKYAAQHKDKPLTLELMLALHRIATQGSSENGVIPGEFRQDDGIYISDGQGNILHQPPAHELIEQRLERLCAFANQKHTGADGGDFIHPIIKAIVLHFMLGYEHPFCDGNGRTARALFYWFMLKSEYALFSYISISKLLKEKAREYGLSFLYTEKDDNDLTYFIGFQLEIIQAAFDELKSYLKHKSQEFNAIVEWLERTPTGQRLNFVQKDLIKKGVKESGRVFSVKEVANSYDISANTARMYLKQLAELKLFLLTQDGKTMLYVAPSDLRQRLKGA